MHKLCCWFCAGFVLSIPMLVMAATHTVQELTPAAVLAAIRLANDGDIVQLPAGTAVWSNGWNTDLDGDGMQEPAPWYNSINGSDIDRLAKTECPAMTNHVKVGRDFFNNTPMPGYKPYIHSHPLQGGFPATKR